MLYISDLVHSLHTNSRNHVENVDSAASLADDPTSKAYGSAD